ncbi:hypothetical protein V8F20_011764 [Naviculisporaceae sp. PSN 640]
MATTAGTDTQPQPTFTAAQVAEHNTRANDWVIIHGQIYDVTKYIHDHPGGIEVLVEAAGQDATEAFENAGHSDDALEIMADFLVGNLEGYQKPAPKRVIHLAVPAETVAAPLPPSRSPSDSSTTAAALAIGSLATLSAAAVYYASNTHPSLSGPASKVTKQVLSHLPQTVNGFPAGFLAASALSAGVSLLAAKQLSTFTQIDHGFDRFPMHKPSTKEPPLAVPAPSTITWLNPREFQSLPLIRKEEVAPSVFRLVFALPTKDAVLGLPTGQHVAIRAVVDDKPVMRSYTPISNDSDKGVLEFIIRCYPDGLLTGRYISTLKAGVDSVHFRGPKGLMRYQRGLAKQIGMIAGGTGITPMYQVIRAICEDPNDETRISLVYANRSDRDILLRKEIEGFASRFPKKLKVWYMLDKEPQGGRKWEYGVGHINKDTLEKRMPKAGGGKENKVFLCGPPGMVNAAKAMLGELGWATPGASAKMEDQVFVF